MSPRRGSFLPLIVAAAFSLVSIAPRYAIAAAREIDVTLKNGASYHGKLVERVPGDHITIQLATGEVKTFAWEDIESDEADEPAPKKKPAPPPTETSEEPGYYVTIKTEQTGVVLEQAIGSTTVGNVTGTHWRRVCTAPCNVEVRGGAYRLNGEGLRSTGTFTIDRNATLEASLGNSGAMTAGMTLLGGGLLFGLIGLISTSGPKNETPTYDPSTGKTGTEPDTIRSAGYVFLVLGRCLNDEQSATRSDWGWC